MIKHAMHYVQRGQKVIDELPALGVVELTQANRELVAAEKALTEAYSKWREAMRLAARGGSTLAYRYLNESEWDLT